MDKMNMVIRLAQILVLTLLDKVYKSIKFIK